MSAATLSAGPAGSAPAAGARERQLLMLAPMVIATLGGWKTQTRRVMSPQPAGPIVVRDLWEDWPGDATQRPPSSWWAFWRYENADRPGEFAERGARSPYGGPGDRLWVRERWAADFEWPEDGAPSLRSWEEMPPAFRGPKSCAYIYYAADGKAYHPVPESAVPDTLPTEAGWQPKPHELARERWRASIHMPRWASRLTLAVTELRAQRIQEISDADARAEGIAAATKDGRLWKYGLADVDGLPGDRGWPWYEWETSPRAAFRRLWDEINAPRGYGWDTNPWVWAITYRRVEVSP